MITNLSVLYERQKFKPFYYGDHLWATTTKFPENYGLLSLRSPRGDYTEPKINF